MVRAAGPKVRPAKVSVIQSQIAKLKLKAYTKLHRQTDGGILGSVSPTRMNHIVKMDKVKKNAKGGVLITPEEIQMAFQLLDIDKTGQISLQNLKRRLGVLFPELSIKDYRCSVTLCAGMSVLFIYFLLCPFLPFILRFLMNNKKDLSMDDLKDLLLDNEITNFDPVAEAYRVFDSQGEGALSGDKLRQAFAAYGMGELSDEELDILIRVS